MTHLAAGRVLGRFRVIGPLGRGGMAAVYRVEETSLGREVALKVLPSELMAQSGFLERFEREAQVIAQLEHPNIVPLYASGIDEGIPWMALRLLTHGTLQERLEAGGLSIDEGLQLFAQVARALDHAHAQGVLHRDLKPQNVPGCQSLQSLDSTAAPDPTRCGPCRLFHSSCEATSIAIATPATHPVGSISYSITSY